MRAFILLLLGILLFHPAHADLSSEANFALSYLFHENELRDDLKTIAQDDDVYYADQTENYFLNLWVKSHNCENGAQPFLPKLADLPADGQQLYKKITTEQRERLNKALDDTQKQLMAEEHNAYKLEYSDEELVALKDSYVAKPALFDLPLTYSRYRALVQPVTLEQKQDGAQRLQLAQQLADAFMLNTPEYELRNQPKTPIYKSDLQQNLVAHFSNENAADTLGTYADFTNSAAGKHYLQQRGKAHNRRYTLLDSAYRKYVGDTQNAMTDAIRALVKNGDTQAACGGTTKTPTTGTTTQ